MQRNLEQRYNIKFCVKLGKTATETIKMLQLAYGDEAMNRTSVFEWHKKCKMGREDVQDDQRAGRPVSATADENVTKVRNLLDSDRRLNVRLIAQELHLRKSSVHSIVTDHLNMRKVCAKLVPNVLTGGPVTRALL